MIEVGQEIYLGPEVGQAALSEGSFTVTAVNTYSFANADNLVFTLKDNNRALPPLLLCRFSDCIAISKPLSLDEIKSLFDMDDFTGVLSGDTMRIRRKGSLKGWEDWFDRYYSRALNFKLGLYYQGNKAALDFNGGHKKRFSYCTLTGNECSIDIEMFDDGEVFFYATVYNDASCVFFSLA